MNGYNFQISGAELTALPSGALWWADHGLLVVSDLHLGKSERMARRGGTLLPPYETSETLTRLDADIAAMHPQTVICLGDSFDDLAAAEFDDIHNLWIARMMAGRRWIWIEGNHDPGPVGLGGEHRADLRLDVLAFRHIAVPGTAGEVSGHYHPKARLAGQSRRCFLIDNMRAILPAYGTYTGGLASQSTAFSDLMGPEALAVLTGKTAQAIPMPR